MRSLCSNPPHPALKHFSQLIRAPFSQDSSAERGQAFRRVGPLRARSTSTTIDNRGARVAKTLRRAVVALRMYLELALGFSGSQKCELLRVKPERAKLQAFQAIMV